MGELLELWAAIAEAPDYEVSTWGRVRWGELEVRTWANKKGYHCVCLEVPGRPRPVLRYVHRLVLEAFVEPAGGRQANHGDGRKGHNELENLAWATAAQNVAHAWATGLIPRVRSSRDVCAHGHPRRPAWQAKRPNVRYLERCSRCRRAQYRRARAAATGLRSLLELL